MYPTLFTINNHIVQLINMYYLLLYKQSKNNEIIAERVTIIYNIRPLTRRL